MPYILYSLLRICPPLFSIGAKNLSSSFGLILSPAHRFMQRPADFLSGDLHQIQFADPDQVRLYRVLRQQTAQYVHQFCLVLIIGHIDEIDQDDAGQVAQTDLPEGGFTDIRIAYQADIRDNFQFHKKIQFLRFLAGLRVFRNLHRRGRIVHIAQTTFTALKNGYSCIFAGEICNDLTGVFFAEDGSFGYTNNQVCAVSAVASTLATLFTVFCDIFTDMAKGSGNRPTRSRNSRRSC